ncbi:MAG: hypothetical protein SWO11_04225 [Thermodesulfobacteriota bacterium]|nr:hypothetical protein [Thermodesulfobacteriota bacterium]
MNQEKNEQLPLFSKWRYQIICHNQLDMTPKEVWEDYNKRARIELNIRDLDYDHFRETTGRDTMGSGLHS